MSNITAVGYEVLYCIEGRARKWDMMYGICAI